MGDNPENERMPEVKQALEALKDAEPQRIAFEDLDFNFGERWIPTGVYAAYMSRLFDTEVKIAYSASMDEFSVVCGYRTMKITDEFLVKGYYRNYDGMHLLKHALHNTCPDMMKSIGKDEHGNDIKMRDSEGIQLANAKIDEIRNGFSEWLEEQSPQFKERLVTMYNRKFNCFVRPRYDGSHQTFPDLNLKGLASRGIKSVYPSQMDCVWMLKQNGIPVWILRSLVRCATSSRSVWTWAFRWVWSSAAATSGGAPRTAAAAKWSGPAPTTSVCWLRL